MKKSLMKVLLLSVIIVFTLVLASCSDTNNLALLERAATQSVEVTDNLDNIAETDLSTSSVDLLSNEISSSSIMNIAFNIEQTPVQKIQEIRQLHTSIVETHFLIVAERNLTRISFMSLRLSIDSIKENSIVLSEDDKLQVDEWVNELREIRTALQATIGHAFAQMRNLRGKYNLENIDHILEVHQEVYDVLLIRYEKIQRVNEILSMADAMLQTYLEF